MTALANHYERGKTIATASQRLFVAPENHDYRLQQPWPGIAAAGDARLFRDLPATPGPRHGRRR